MTYSYNKANEMHYYLKFIFGLELYMFWTGLSVSPGSPPPKISDRSQKLEMSQNAVKENDNVLNTGREVERRCMNLKDVKNLYKYIDMLHTHIYQLHITMYRA